MARTISSDSNDDKMYTSGVLSNLNPVLLQQKVSVELGIHCGCRGREGWRELLKDSFVKMVDSDGGTYYTMAYPEYDKNHHDNETKNQCMYEVGTLTVQSKVWTFICPK